MNSDNTICHNYKNAKICITVWQPENHKKEWTSQGSLTIHKKDYSEDILNIFPKKEIYFSHSEAKKALLETITQKINISFEELENLFT